MAKPQRAPQKQVRLPAPLGGLNSMESLLTTPVTDGLLIENLVIRPFGIEIRKGWKYWYNDAFPAEVRSILCYTGSSPNNRKMFCSTAEAGAGKFGPLYDITFTAASRPTVPALIPSTAPDIPGEWSSTMFLAPGQAYLCAVQQGAGYYTYSSTAGWVESVVGAGSGTTVKFPTGDLTTTKDFAFVMAWKNRLWFICRNSAKAYYLPTNQVYGNLEVFNFGQLMPHGGNLQLLMNWTYDGGNGIDDALVAVSDQGDLLIYKGTDPAVAANFSLLGIWYIGVLPVGRRNFAQQGGDLWIATEYGVISVSDYVSGRVTAPISQTTAAGKFNPSLARNVSITRTQKYWFMLPYPAEELLIVGSPHINPTFGTRVSWIMSAITKAWSSMTNVDPLCAEIYDSQLFVGDRNGFIKLCFFGYRDGDSYNSAVEGSEVTARFMTGFYDYGSPNMNKRISRVRLLGVSDGVPSYVIKMKSEYDMNELLSTPSPVRVAGALWDVALWDVQYWQFPQKTFKSWYGVRGFGKKISTQIAIRGSGYTLLTDYEVTYEEGIGL